MNSPEKIELLGLNIPELEEIMIQFGEPRFRGRQLYKWIYQKGVNSAYEMSDIPWNLREKLDEQTKISIPRVLKQRVSADGTRKFLFELEDKKNIETVLIPQTSEKNSTYSLCISTQIGCPVCCTFCATGLSGLQRNLKAYEIIGQFLGSRNELKKRLKVDHPQLITNIVYMGMGEPLLNYKETIESIRLFTDHKGINIGQRHITVSTSGEIKGIELLAKEDLQITLAISLHAADNDLRSSLIPLNRKYPLEKVIMAVEKYIKCTNRRVTFEYIMLDGINVSKKDANNVINIVKPLLANINLIPYNEVENIPYKKPPDNKIYQFYKWLRDAGLNVTIREEKGADIEAACGQLKAERWIKNR
jgi:23S rRNA (adenine2503-C2)-methyltransferase